MDDVEAPGGDGVFTERLRWLFENVIDPATGLPYTYASASREITARVAHLPPEERDRRKMSLTYFWQLVAGHRINPTRLHMESLAILFGVPVSYLSEPATDADHEADLKLAIALRGAGIEQLAMRAWALSAGGKKLILQMIEHVREIEGVPESADPGGDAPPGSVLP